jgi:hypothetical protein
MSSFPVAEFCQVFEVFGTVGGLWSLLFHDTLRDRPALPLDGDRAGRAWITETGFESMGIRLRQGVGAPRHVGLFGTLSHKGLPDGGLLGYWGKWTGLTKRSVGHLSHIWVG